MDGAIAGAEEAVGVVRAFGAPANDRGARTRVRRFARTRAAVGGRHALAARGPCCSTTCVGGLGAPTRRHRIPCRSASGGQRMSCTPYVTTMAAYNAWMNEKVYTSAARLPEDEVR